MQEETNFQSGNSLITKMELSKQEKKNYDGLRIAMISPNLLLGQLKGSQQSAVHPIWLESRGQKKEIIPDRH